MKYKEIVRTLFSEYEKAYKCIRRQAITNAKDDTSYQFSDDFDRSYRYALSNPRYALLNCSILRLAHLWDQMLLVSRKKAAENEAAVVIPQHTFMVLPPSKTRDQSPTARLYCKNMPPDNRMIFIQMSSNRTKDFLCTLHEMGHFIGYRMRKKRLQDYFLPMIAEAVCLQWYDYSCKLLFDRPIDSKERIGCSLHIESNYAQRVRNSSSEIVIGFQRVYPRIKNEIQKRYYAYLDDYLSGCKKSGEQLEGAEANGTEAGFFTCVEAIMLIALSDYLSDKEFWDKCILDIISGVSQQQDEVEQCIRAAIRSLQEEVDQGKPAWYEEYEKRLEEPAADIFMLKMSKASAKKYIQLITEQLQELFASEVYSIEQLNTTLAMPSNTVRFLSVCAALHAQKSDFIYPMDKIIKALPWRTDALERAGLRAQLWAMFESAKKLRKEPNGECDFLDPTRYVFQYVEELMNDSRYSSDNAQIKEGQRLTLQTMKIWTSPFARLWAYIALVYSHKSHGQSE